MRLSKADAQAIKQVLRQTLGDNIQVWLFGSRVDDCKRGGDLDLYVETNAPCSLADRLRMMTKIQIQTGLRKVDLIVCDTNEAEREIAMTAKKEGIVI